MSVQNNCPVINLFYIFSSIKTTPEKFNRIDDLEEKIGPLETILLNKDAYLDFASGDGACVGCSEKSVIHLFVATVESLMQPCYNYKTL